MIKEIFKATKKGYACGLTITGELFLGYISSAGDIVEADYFKNTEENRKKLIDDWDFYRYGER